jgi:hypothetical protein
MTEGGIAWHSYQADSSVDDASRNIIEFLTSLQGSMERFGMLWNHCTERGARPRRPCLTLSGRPFRKHEGGDVREFGGCIAIALPVNASDGREIEFGVDVLWDDRGWTIMTEAWAENDQGGQDLLRELPERHARDLRLCLEQLERAIEDLFGFQELVSQRS